MKQSIITLLISICVLWTSCEHLFRKKEEIKLRVSVKDSSGSLLSGASVILYANPAIRNSDAATRTAGLLADTTNGAGTVEFLLPKEKDEELVYYATVSLSVGQVNWSNLHDSGEILIGEDEKDDFEAVITVFTPAELDNSMTTTGMKVVVQDQFGNAVPAATVCLYQNPVASMVNVYSCTGSVASGTSDTDGVATIFNLSPTQTYYINAFTQIGGVTLGNDQVFESVTLQENRLTNVGTVSISTVSIAENSSFLIVNIVDSGGVPIPDSEVCLFLEDEAAIEAQDCQGSLRSKVTDDFGLVVFTNLDSLSYHMASFKDGKKGVQTSEKPLNVNERRLVQIALE